MVTAELIVVAKEALVPDAPVPVFPYSWNVTSAVFGKLEDQTSQPALLIIALKTVFWKSTLAYSDHGRPR
jgi:hypothetical protein